MKSLWPEFEKDEKESPVSILKEVASDLYEITDGLLDAKVNSKYIKEKIQHRFVIVAPSMDNYSYELMIVMHGIDMYPVYVHHWNTEGNEIRQEAETKEKYVEVLEEVLKSAETKRIIEALMTQSQE